QVDDLLDGHPVDLDVLARGDVRDPSAIAVRNLGHDVHLRRAEHAARNLDALHVARVVELVVEAVGQPDGAPRVAGQLAFQKACQSTGVPGKCLSVLLLGGTHETGAASMGAGLPRSQRAPEPLAETPPPAARCARRGDGAYRDPPAGSGSLRPAG